LQPAFDVNVPTALKILARNFGEAAETDDSEPFDALLLRALRVLPVLIDRDAEFGHGFTLLRKAGFRRVAQNPIRMTLFTL